MSENAKITLAAGRYMARDKAPYLRAMILGLAPVEAPGLGTIGVTQHGVLLVDWEFIDKCTPEECAGLLVHEALHMILHHHERGAGLDHRLANIAMDLAINPAVLDMGLSLPGGGPGVTPNHPMHGAYPEDYGWSRGQSMDEYYDRLRLLPPPPPSPQGGSGEGDGPKPKTGGGHCGSCAGNPMPNEPDEAAKEARSENELHRIRRTVAENIRAHKQQCGGGRGSTVPAFLERWADKILAPAQVPWQKELAVVTRQAVAWRENAVDHRYDAPSRRQAGVGFGPGKPILPRFRMPVPNVAVILDTSGSMGVQELSEAGREINGVLKAVGAHVTFCTCDAEVTGVTKVRTLDEALSRMRGGGGTDMRPAFAALVAQRPRPEVIVCATDLAIGDPGPPPAGAKVIWVAVGAYAKHCADPAWGKVIRTTSAKK